MLLPQSLHDKGSRAACSGWAVVVNGLTHAGSLQALQPSCLMGLVQAQVKDWTDDFAARWAEDADTLADEFTSEMGSDPAAAAWVNQFAQQQVRGCLSAVHPGPNGRSLACVIHFLSQV